MVVLDLKTLVIFMVGRKPQSSSRVLVVKNLYLPEDTLTLTRKIAGSVTTSAMELYTQAVKSYFALNHETYMAWMRADWEATGLAWPRYVEALMTGESLPVVSVPHIASSLADVTPIVVNTPPTTINSMILPEITILLVSAAARREGMSINKIVSQIVKWHVARYWHTNYARLLRDYKSIDFIRNAGTWPT